jgi:uncharacterized membrane protein YedE/YeeE
LNALLPAGSLAKSIYTGSTFTISYPSGFLFGVGMTLGSGCGSKTASAPAAAT